MDTPYDWWQIIREAPDLRGEPGLWLAVIMDALETVKEARSHPEQEVDTAKRFLTDQESNFNLAVSVLGYDPDALRKRIQSALFDKSKKD